MTHTTSTLIKQFGTIIMPISSTQKLDSSKHKPIKRVNVPHSGQNSQVNDEHDKRILSSPENRSSKNQTNPQRTFTPYKQFGTTSMPISSTQKLDSSKHKPIKRVNVPHSGQNSQVNDEHDKRILSSPENRSSKNQTNPQRTFTPYKQFGTTSMPISSTQKLDSSKHKPIKRVNVPHSGQNSQVNDEHDKRILSSPENRSSKNQTNPQRTFTPYKQFGTTSMPISSTQKLDSSKHKPIKRVNVPHSGQNSQVSDEHDKRILSSPENRSSKNQTNPQRTFTPYKQFGTTSMLTSEAKDPLSAKQNTELPALTQSRMQPYKSILKNPAATPCHSKQERHVVFCNQLQSAAWI